MPVQNICPHCDSPRVEEMHRRTYEDASPMTWYQCLDCRRMWSLTKPPISGTPENGNSPESS